MFEKIAILAHFHYVKWRFLLVLYGSESWVLNQHGRDKLTSFHNRCARFLTGRFITKVDEEWIYPDTQKTLELAHLLPVEEYIIKRRKTLEESYALNSEIYEECVRKSIYIKGNNNLEWWTKNHSINNNNNNIINNNNNINESEYNVYDPNEIEIEWWTEEITNSEINILN